MIKETAGRRKSAKSAANRRASAGKKSKDGFATLEAFLPTGSPQRAAAGIAAAAGGALLFAAKFGVRPAALAVAAGYLAYCSIYGNEKTNKLGLSLINDVLQA
jgi:hypothetical protein